MIITESVIGSTDSGIESLDSAPNPLKIGLWVLAFSLVHNDSLNVALRDRLIHYR